MMRIFWCGIFLFGVILFLLSGQRIFSKPVIFTRTEVQELSVTEKSQNQKALDDLGETKYVVYRIAERIIRANNLDQYPWRIYFNLNPQEINACSEAANLITLETGLADSFNNDYSALAFIISHEMSHHLLFHSKYYADMMDSYNKQIEDAKKRAKQLDFKLAEDSYDNPRIYFGEGFIRRLVQDRIEVKRQNDLKNIHEQYNTEENNKKMAEDALRAFSRQQEAAADRLGIVLMVKAGFDPSGMERTFVFLDRMPFPQDIKDADHPSNAQRIQYINSQISSMNINQLIEEGKSNLGRTKLLGYKKSIDNKSFIINANSPSNNSFDFFNDTKPSTRR